VPGNAKTASKYQISREKDANTEDDTDEKAKTSVFLLIFFELENQLKE